VYLDKNIISLSVIPIAQDLGIDAGQKGLILSAFFLGYTLFDQIDERKAEAQTNHQYTH
jgi:MFS family permease